VAEVRFTWGQLQQIAAALGLRPEDPPPTADMIFALFDAQVTVAEEADRIALGLADDDDG
jgi:hypothetical protein